MNTRHLPSRWRHIENSLERCFDRSVRVRQPLSAEGVLRTRGFAFDEDSTLTGTNEGVSGQSRPSLLVTVEAEALGATELHDALENAESWTSETRVLLPPIGSNPRAHAQIRRTLDFLRSRGFRFLTYDHYLNRWSAVPRGETPPTRELPMTHTMAVQSKEFLSIAIFAHSSDLGGAERTTLELCRGLVSRGHVVTVFLPNLDGPLAGALEVAGVPSIATKSHLWVGIGGPSDPSRAATGLSPMITDLLGIRPDCALTMTGAVIVGGLAASLLDIPHAWYVQERMDPDYGVFPPHPDPVEVGRVFRRFSDAICTNSQFVSSHFFPDEEIPVVAPIRGDELDAPSPSRRVIGQRPSLAVLGQISTAKGQVDAVRAVRVLLDRGMTVDLHLHGWGSPADIEALEAEVAELGVASQVWRHGFTEDPQSAISRADIVVVPSWAEAFGRVPVEAIAMGVPVVYIGNGGLLEYMQDGRSGVAAKPQDPDSLADAISRLVEDDDLRAAVTGGAGDVVRKWLDEHPLVAGITDLLHCAVERRAAARNFADVLVTELTVRNSYEGSR